MNLDEAQRKERTVLVVDDEPPIRELASRILLRDGYTVLVAGSGEEALRVAEENSDTIGLLLCDIDMPRMTGRTLADRLMATRRKLKVLFMSGHAADRLTQLGFVPTAGVPFLNKPFGVAELSGKVREVLDAQV